MKTQIRIRIRLIHVYLIILVIPVFLLWSGCANIPSRSETIQISEVPVVEKLYSNDPNLTVGIANIHNRVSLHDASSIEKNKQRILDIIDLLKSYNVNMILIPEFCLTGYFWKDTAACWEYMRQGVTDRHMEWVQEIRNRLDDRLYYVIFNNIRLNPDNPSGPFLNSTCVIDKHFNVQDLDSPENEEKNIYDKTFLPGIENTFTLSGETDSLILDTDWGKIGFTTCYDMCFTELFQEYGMVDQVDALIQLASWRGTASRDYPGMGVHTDHYYGFIWDAMTTSQAAYNQYWIIGCNSVGYQQRGKYKFWGGSGLWAPSGMRLYEASHDREELIVIHNIEMKEEVRHEQKDFYYRSDFLKVYEEIKELRTFTRVRN